MNIDNLTIKEARELAAMFQQSQAAHPYKIGEVYLIRTVTMIDVGRVVAVFPTEVVLEDACWVADTGRFAQAVATGEYGETEPFPDGEVIVGRGSIIDAVRVPKTIRVQK